MVKGALRTLVPLKRMCSRKCAAPLVSSVSNLLPELIQTPTVAVSAKGMCSVATRRPLGRVVTCARHRVRRWLSAASL